MVRWIANCINRIGYAIAVCIILAALFVSVSQLLMPYLNEHLPDFETWAAQELHVPVKINHVHLSWDVYEPVIAFDGVTVLDDAAKQAKFSIRQIKVNVNMLRSLLAFKPVLESLKVSGVHLTVQQHPSGQLHIEELKLFSVVDKTTGSPSDADKVLTWIFAQPNLMLADVDITYHPTTGPEKSITINELALANTITHHKLTGKGILNQEVPTHVTLHAAWQGNITDLSQVNAKLYLYLEGVSLPQWLAGKTWQHLTIQQGLGSAKIWAKWGNNQWQKIRSQFQFYDVEWQALLTKKVQQMPRLSGDVTWERRGEKQIFSGNDILIDLPEHLWPTNHFALTLTPAGNTYQVEKAEVTYLDLADLHHLAAQSGLLTSELQKTLSSLHLKGELRNVAVEFSQGANWNHLDLNKTKLSTEFSGLEINAWQKYPGIMHAGGLFTWDGTQGSLKLLNNNTTFFYQKMFANPLHFDHITGLLKWKKAADGAWSLSADNVSFANADLKATINTELSIPLNDTPTVNLAANFNVTKMANLVNHLPLVVMPPELSEWLRNAFLSGQLQAGKVIVQGRLADFPFEKGNGKFLVTGLIDNLDFNFAPKWPVIKHVKGLLTFAGAAMRADIHSGQLLNTPLTNVEAIIPYIGERAPQILHVKTTVQLNAADGLNLIRRSPLQKNLGQDLAPLDLSGPMKLNLDLTVPLKKPENTQVVGDITLVNDRLVLPQWNLTLNQVNGLLHFTEKDIQATNLQAKIFDSQASVTLATLHDKQANYLQVDLTSVINMAKLQKWVKIPVLTHYFNGEAPLTAQVRLAAHDNPVQTTQVSLRSDLKGISINLPRPYAKKAEEISDFKVDISIKPNQPVISKISYGKLLSSALSFEKNAQGFRLLSGALLLGEGEASVPAAPGFFVTAQFKELNWETLQTYIDWFNEQKNQPFPARVASAAMDKSMTNLFQGVTLKAVTANFFGQRLDNADIEISKGAKNWQIDMSSSQVAGQAVVMNDLSAVDARFQRFYVVGGGQSSAPLTINPKTLPALSISANDVRLGEKRIGAISFDTVPGKNGMVIKQFQLNSGIAELNAAGSWQLAGKKGYISHLQGRLTTSKVTQMLTQWGLTSSALVGNQGKANFDLNWRDAPMNPSMASMSGTLSIKLGPGRIVNLGDSTEAKLGLGRLLNVLSLQSIPRRLSLNFSDLFGNGYSFDRMEGDFRLQNGNAYTDNMQIEGAVAHVSLAGRIGLAAKDFDLRLGVAAHVTSSLPMVATLALGLNPIGAAIGAGTFVVDKLISSRAAKASSYDYKITGSWDNPVWQVIGAGK